MHSDVMHSNCIHASFRVICIIHELLHSHEMHYGLYTLQYMYITSHSLHSVTFAFICIRIRIHRGLQYNTLMVRIIHRIHHYDASKHIPLFDAFMTRDTFLLHNISQSFVCIRITCIHMHSCE